MFRCRQCHEPGFLIFGLCAQCAPAEHAAHSEALAISSAANKAFKAATGKDSLLAWEQYEAWLESHPEFAVPLAERMKLLQPPHF